MQFICYVEWSGDNVVIPIVNLWKISETDWGTKLNHVHSSLDKPLNCLYQVFFFPIGTKSNQCPQVHPVVWVYLIYILFHSALTSAFQTVASTLVVLQGHTWSLSAVICFLSSCWKAQQQTLSWSYFISNGCSYHKDFSCITNSCLQFNLSVKMGSTVLDRELLIMPKEASA